MPMDIKLPEADGNESIDNSGSENNADNEVVIQPNNLKNTHVKDMLGDFEELDLPSLENKEEEPEKESSEKTPDKEGDKVDDPLDSIKRDLSAMRQENALLKAQVQQQLSNKPVEQKETVSGLLEGMSKEDYADFIAEDPQGFVNAILRATEEKIGASVSTSLNQKVQEASVGKTLQKFSDANPDFKRMFNNGELGDFVSSNPGHNVYSAYSILTKERDIAAAVKKAQEDIINNNKAMRGAKTLKGGVQSSASSKTGVEGIANIADMRKNPAKYGGSKAVLLKVLQATKGN